MDGYKRGFIIGLGWLTWSAAGESHVDHLPVGEPEKRVSAQSKKLEPQGHTMQSQSEAEVLDVPWSIAGEDPLGSVKALECDVLTRGCGNSCTCSR